VQAGKISTYIKPLNLLLDIAAVSVLGSYFFNYHVQNTLHFLMYEWFFWCAIAYFAKYYEVYRFTHITKLAYKAACQLSLYTIAIAGFFIFSHYVVFSYSAIALYSISLLAVSLGLKIISFFIYRSLPVYSHNNTVMLGNANYLPAAEKSRLLKIFSPGKNNAENQIVVDQVIAFAKTTPVQTIYCSLAQITPSQAYILNRFSQNNAITLKFIPDTNNTTLKNLSIDYFEEFPVFIALKTPLHNPALKIFKRIFDIIFSSLIIIFILSWLTPIIAIIIKLETKGPVFFKQGRPGIEETEFICYKFRSMGVNRNPEAMAVKNDARVTKSGKFLRKTSLDELPQFFNVFLGDMSVVGPRPQLWYHNNEYKGHIHKFSDRLLVKPGITGLAQVSGYRGEINSNAEMQNRVRYDVFYIENWSILLDIRIIIQTVVNIFMGEEKAY
jgi:putative colanic acid biosysnthesis UDP-glucose lipid carrier transferase